MKNTLSSGSVFCLPAPLTPEVDIDTIPASSRAAVQHIRHFFVEDTKTAARILSLVYSMNLSECRLYRVSPERNTWETQDMLDLLRDGKDVGILSESGLSGVADPGSHLVAAAHAFGFRVIPLAGVSSITLALSGSGLPGQKFRFVGYLPKDLKDRKREIERLEKWSAQEQGTVICIEAPHRNTHLFMDLSSELRPDTRLCVASALLEESGFIETRPAGEWMGDFRDLGKKPTIFLWSAPSERSMQEEIRKIRR